MVDEQPDGDGDDRAAHGEQRGDLPAQPETVERGTDPGPGPARHQGPHGEGEPEGESEEESEGESEGDPLETPSELGRGDRL